MPRTLLVVDDSATMRKVFEITFAGEDITVFAHDGSASLLDHAREQRPAAAVVDVSLGGPDAYGIVRALKADAALAGLPVLLLYSEHSPVDEGRAREAGADGTLQKPFDTQAAIDRVKQLLGGARAQPAAPAAAATPARVPGAVAPPPMAPATSTRPSAPSAAGVGSVGSRAPVAGGNKATQMFVSPPSNIPQPPPVQAAPPPPAMPRPVAPPPPVAAPPRAVAPPVRRDSVELEVDFGGEEDITVDPVSMPRAAAPQPASHGAAVGGIAAEVGQRVAAMGLTAAQADAVTALTREVIERVVWEVVPQLAETMIREEIRRLTAE